MTYPAESRPVVYRVYDADGRLIYVGASRDVAGRFEVHINTTWWVDLAVLVTTEEYPTMDAAYAAETVAIQEEQPAFNVKGTGRYHGEVTPADLAHARRWREGGQGRTMPLWLLDGIYGYGWAAA